MANSAPRAIAETQAQFARGVSPVSVVENCLQRIEQSNAAYGAMIFVARQEALDEAK